MAPIRIKQARKKPRNDEQADAKEAVLLNQILKTLKANFSEHAGTQLLYLIKVGTTVILENVTELLNITWNHFQDDSYTPNPGFNYHVDKLPNKNACCIHFKSFSSRLNCKDFVSFTAKNETDSVNIACLLINKGERIDRLNRILKESAGPFPTETRKRRFEDDTFKANKRRREEEIEETPLVPPLLLPTPPLPVSSSASTTTAVMESISMDREEENLVESIKSIESMLGLDFEDYSMDDVARYWNSLPAEVASVVGDSSIGCCTDMANTISFGQMQSLLETSAEPVDEEWKFDKLFLLD